MPSKHVVGGSNPPWVANVIVMFNGSMTAFQAVRAGSIPVYHSNK